MEHDKDYTPYNSSNLRYFVKSPSISGPSTICSSETYEVPNLPSGATVSWTTTGAISISGSNTANPVTVIKTANSTGTLTASVNTACGSVTLPVKNITAGLFNVRYTPWGTTYVTDLGDDFTYDIPEYPDAISYEWLISGPPVLAYSDGGNWVDVIFPYAGYYDIQVKITMPCGEVMSYMLLVEVDYSQSRAFSYFPNPATDQLTVSYEAPKKQDVKGETFANKVQIPVFEIKLLDNKGLVLKSAKSEGNKNAINISTEDVPNGTYFLHIINKGKTIKKQIVVQH